MYSKSGLGIIQEAVSYSDIISKLQLKGDNAGVEFGGWTASYTHLQFPAGIGQRFYMSIRYYTDGYAYAELTDLSNAKRYLSTINVSGKTEFDTWVQL